MKAKLSCLLFLVLFSATTVWGGIGIDQTIWSDRSSSSTIITTPVFSTTYPNELLLAFISTDARTGSMGVTSVSGAGLTWTLVRRTNAQLGTAEIWRAFAAAPLSRVSVRASLAQNVAASITVVSFAGVDTSGTNGSGAIGAIASASASSGAPSVTLVTTRASSWVFGVGTDWDHPIPRTPGPDQTIVHQFMPTVGDTYWVQRQNNPTSLAGTSVTINDTAPTSDRYNLTACEIVPALPFPTPTYSISGTITPTAGGSGTTVVLSGAASATTTADASGNYSFSGLGNGSYTITPSKSGFTFSPSSQTATVNGANITSVNFSATAVTYSISGTITPTANGAGATLTLTGAASATTTADASGNYSFSGLGNGSYTVTPSKPGVTFSPNSQTAAVNGANVTGVNFSATAVTYSISGTITPAANGNGATLTLSGAASATTTTDASGNYSFSGLGNGSYTVTPSKSGFTFSPSSQTATVNGGNVTGVNFSATAVTYSISGTITPPASGSGATLTLSGAASATTTADGSGNYSFTGLANGSYTITPSKAGFVFTPANQAVNVADATVSDINFVSAAATGLAIDALVSRDSNTAANSVTTSTFSTSVGNELLLAFISSDGISSGMTVTGVSGAGLTWTLVRRTNAQLGTAEIWRAFATAPLAGVSVRASLAQNVASSITIVSFTGADTSGTNGSGAIGAVASANAGSGAPSVTLITTRNSSWVFGVGTDWDRPIARTPGTDQTVIHQFMPSVGDTYWVQRRNSTTPLAGTSVTINDTAPTSDRYNLTACEILPAPPVPNPTYIISGTITPPETGSGSTVALTGTATVTTTADASGSYSFSGLLDGPYTVTPSKPGVTFSPAMQNVTVAGASVVGVNFSAAPAAETWTVSGTITPAASGSGATLTLTGAANRTTTADASGNYSFGGLLDGSYVITPSKSGFVFSPVAQNLTVHGANVTVAEFIATGTWTIAGAVTPASNGTGTTLTLTGTAGASTTADASGSYSFSGLRDGSYTVTPSKDGFVFDPASTSVTLSGASVTGVNFNATSFASNLTVDGSQTLQTMDGMGTNINTWSWSNKPDVRIALDYLVDTAGASLFRVIHDRMDWAAQAQIAGLHNLDPATLAAVYESPDWQDVWNMLAYLNNKGVRGNQIALNFMGWTATWMGGSGQYNVVSKINTSNNMDMATMIASAIYYGRAIRGVDFKLVSPFNEPDWNGLEGPQVGSSQFTAIAADLVSELNAMGQSDVYLVMPDTAGGPDGYTNDAKANVIAWPRIRTIGYHAYPGGVSYASPPANSGVPRTAWMDETSVWCSSCDGGGGTDGTRPSNEWTFARDSTDVLMGDVENGFEAVLTWEGYDTNYWHHSIYTQSAWGMIGYDHTAQLYTPRKCFYTFGTLFKAARPGSARISASNTLSFPHVLAFYDIATGHLAIVGQSGSGSKTINGRLTNLPTIASLKAYFTDSGSNNLTAQPDVVVNSQNFSIVIPSQTFFLLMTEPGLQ